MDLRTKFFSIPCFSGILAKSQVEVEVILIKVVGIRLVGSRVCGRDSDAGGLQVGGI